MSHISSGLGSKAVKTFALLDQIVTVLGGTKLTFYPIITPVGTDVFPYGSGSDAPVATPSDEAAAVALDAEFDPVRLNGVYGVYFDSSANNHINCGDDADFSHGDASVDTAFSCGAWVYPTEALGSVRTILAKYGSTANLEEYDFRFDASGQLVLELHDASASTSEIATGADGVVLTPWVWNFVVATYDGEEATPGIHLYVNAADQNAAGASVEAGAYVAMEDTAAGLLIGARDATGTPAQEFEGYLALPFMTGKELTAANVTTLYGIEQKLLGL